MITSPCVYHVVKGHQFILFISQTGHLRLRGKDLSRPHNLGSYAGQFLDQPQSSSPYCLLRELEVKSHSNVCVLVAWSCLTPSDPMECSLPGILCPWDSPGKNTGVGNHSFLQGIFQT